MPDTDVRETLVANLRKAAEAREEQAAANRRIADALDDLLEVESKALDPEDIDVRPPHPDEYRIRAEDMEREAALLRWAADRVEAGEEDQQLLKTVKATTEGNIPARDGEI